MMGKVDRNVVRALRGEAPKPVPIWLMRQAGRYLPEYRALRAKAKNFLEFCYTPELAVEATLQPIRRYDFDAAILFSDILVVPDAMGVPVAFREGEGPIVGIADRGMVDGLSASGIETALGPVYDAMASVRRQLDPGKTLIGFAGGPWTVALYMLEGRSGLGGAVAKEKTARDPDFVDELVTRLAEATVVHLDCQIRSGADVVQIFESWAGVLEPGDFERYVVRPTERIVAEIRKRHPNVPIVGFPRGAGSLYIEYAVRTGVDAINLDSAVDLEWAERNLHPRVALQGNLDNFVLRQGGKPLEEAVFFILEAMGRHSFVFNLGHGILPDTPTENVAKVVALVRGWQGGGKADDENRGRRV